MAEQFSNTVTDEMEVAFSGPSIYSNRFYVSLIGNGVRIGFTEQVNPEKLPNYRTSVFLSAQDAVSLQRLLKTLLQDIEKQLEAEEGGSNV